MKNKRRIIIILCTFLVLLGVGSLFIFYLNDKDNKLTVNERNWINNNIDSVENINIINNANVFGKNAEGVFYDFLNDFSLEYKMHLNPITYNYGSNLEGITLALKNNLGDNDLVFYTDHYVLVSKKEEIIINSDNLLNKRIGININNENYIKTYLNNLSFQTFITDDELYQALNNNEIDYMVVPLIQYLDLILSNNYNIVYHFGDIPVYYVLQKNDEILSTILAKFYSSWQKNLEKYFFKHEFELFLTSLNITDAQVDKLQSVVHNYGFVNTSPYEVIMGGKYGGIVAVYLSNFSQFANVDFNFVKYHNLTKFNEALENNNIELYFNYYNLNNNDTTINGPIIKYNIITKKSNSNVVNSLNSLKNKTVFVENNSKLANYLKTISNINIKAYDNLNNLRKEIKKIKDEYYIMIDNNIYEYYQNNYFKDYIISYTNSLNGVYEFKVRNNDILANLMKKYFSTLDKKVMETKGLENHYEVTKTGSIMSQIAKYVIALILILIVIVIIIIKKSKKITVARRIKKDDKMKFIDQLTSLKNRNYLNENISVWNNNTIYPQAIIVVDLNKIQEINDVYGYAEGDKQIMALANALIKTQLDNSEIMRTDGNEFVIYVVGYSEKQVSNYMHKLTKEIAKLPYDFGAEFGHSMIMDNIKTIEDAMNEAVEDMKKQKETNEK